MKVNSEYIDDRNDSNGYIRQDTNLSVVEAVKKNNNHQQYLGSDINSFLGIPTQLGVAIIKNSDKGLFIAGSDECISLSYQRDPVDA